MTLARSPRSDDDDVDALAARVAALEQALAQRASELARAQSDLATFRIRYHRDVGFLHEELDDLERKIAEAELGEFARRLGEASAGAAAAATPPPTAARFTSDAVRKLFREVARTIHPDLASDDLARDRRHTLMIEANRAYARGDEERLRSILDLWERSPEAVQGEDAEAARLRLVRRVAQIEEQVNAAAADLAVLHESPLWQLRAMVDAAEARGKDLVEDMVRRLKRDIMAARNRLDAMTWNP